MNSVQQGTSEIAFPRIAMPVAAWLGSDAAHSQPLRSSADAVHHVFGREGHI